MQAGSESDPDLDDMYMVQRNEIMSAPDPITTSPVKQDYMSPIDEEFGIDEPRGVFKVNYS